jgi:hypothetical protein
MKRTSGGQLSREAKPRFYQVTPWSSDGGGRHKLCRSAWQRRRNRHESAHRQPEDLPHGSDVTAPTAEHSDSDNRQTRRGATTAMPRKDASPCRPLRDCFRAMSEHERRSCLFAQRSSLRTGELAARCFLGRRRVHPECAGIDSSAHVAVTGRQHDYRGAALLAGRDSTGWG